MATENDLVMYQIAEQTGDVVSFTSFPAVVTSRTLRPLAKLDAKGGAMKDDKGEIIYGEPVEVLSLTVFIVGGFEFYTDVVPYAGDETVLMPARTYRAWGSEAPKIAAKPAEPVAAPAKKTLL
jgi:hypothetical protein